jgi:hypothetical protein
MIRTRWVTLEGAATVPQAEEDEIQKRWFTYPHDALNSFGFRFVKVP